MFRKWRTVFLAAVAATAAACASAGPSSSSRFGPGEVVVFDGNSYQMLQVDQDFVLMRHREPVGEAGGISGYVDEVFRVSRYKLADGRWVSPERAPGIALQWLGLETFALSKDDFVLPAPSVEGGSEVVLVEPAPAGK
jgi:hypothetical protein